MYQKNGIKITTLKLDLLVMEIGPGTREVDARCSQIKSQIRRKLELITTIQTRLGSMATIYKFRGYWQHCIKHDVRHLHLRIYNEDLQQICLVGARVKGLSVSFHQPRLIVNHPTSSSYLYYRDYIDYEMLLANKL